MKIDVLYNSDCMIDVSKIPDKAFDIVICDPPYILKKHYQGSRLDSFKSHLKVIDETFGSDFNPVPFLNHFFPKSKNGIVAWCSALQLPIYINYAIKKKYKWEIMVWCKSNGMPNGFQHLRSDLEYCVRMYKKGAYFNNKLTNSDYSRWFVAGTTKSNWIKHPCVKPLKLMEKQVLLFSKEGDIICDPFAGSGTTLVAAKRHGRRYVGYEINKDFYSLAMDRLEKECGQTTLFDDNSSSAASNG